MTSASTPEATPSKLKTWIGLAGSLLTFVIPLIVSVQDILPPPWPGVIGVVLAILTALGIYHAPYKPTGTVLVPDSPAVTHAVATGAPPPPSGYQAGW